MGVYAHIYKLYTLFVSYFQNLICLLRFNGAIQNMSSKAEFESLQEQGQRLIEH